MVFSAAGFSLSMILNALITLSVVAVFIAVCADFFAYDTKAAVKKSRRSIVATGSMLGFYVVYYLALRFQLGCARVRRPGADGLSGMYGLLGADGLSGMDGLIGADGFPGADGFIGTGGFPGAGLTVPYRAAVVMGVAGAMMIIAGALINILGRTRLKGNWANHIKIYEDHSLADSGVYKLVRHPLYASIILMFFGGSLAYRNWLSAILTAIVFIPFMYYRARQEEALLIGELPGYREYMRKTGMFFPKLWKDGDSDGGV